MLEWSSLSRQQKSTCVFMALVATIGLVALLMNEALNLGNILGAIAIACLFSSILLNPALVRGASISILSGKRVPAVCTLLGFAALGFFVLSRIL